MKILFVLDTLETGGSEISTLEIARRLRQTEVIVVHLYPGRRLRPRFEAAGLRVVSLDLPGRYALRRGALALAELIRSEEPDVVHSTLFRAGLVARFAARRTGVPLVDSLVNDTYSLRWRRGLSPIHRLKLLGLRLLDAATARWVTRFVAVSETVKESYVDNLGLKRDRITIIPRGRDPDRYGPVSPKRREEIRQSLDLSPDEPLLLQIARLLPRKGQVELLEAFRKLSQEVPRTRLWIAGEGPQRSRLERLLREDGLHRARLLGTRSDVPDLLSAADVFVFPSHYEGHPGALIEAMLAGLPIVASDTPAHRESIEPERTGLLVPVEDPEALAAAMLRLLRDRPLAERLGREARQVACERFSIETIAARHEALYRELAGETV